MKKAIVFALLLAFMFSCKKDQFWGTCSASFNGVDWEAKSVVSKKNDSLFNYFAIKSGFEDNHTEDVQILNIPLKVGKYAFKGRSGISNTQQDMFGFFAVLAGGDVQAGIYELREYDSANFIEILDDSGQKISGKFNLHLYLDTIKWHYYKDILPDSVLIENAVFTAKF